LKVVCGSRNFACETRQDGVCRVRTLSQFSCAGGTPRSRPGPWLATETVILYASPRVLSSGIYRRRFGGTYRLHLQGRRISRARNQRESMWQDVSGPSTETSVNLYHTTRTWNRTDGCLFFAHLRVPCFGSRRGGNSFRTQTLKRVAALNPLKTDSLLNNI
jgi:hypothetical protein